MAISKVILNNTTLIDVTQKTVTADSMLSGMTALKNDGTDITGNIATKTSSNLSSSGATVTAPAGYYASDASKSISNGSATTPATSITANPSISVSSGGLITASVSASQSVTPTVSAGYVSSGTAGTVSVSGSNTSQLTAQAAQTIHPSTSDQTIASGKYLTGTQTVKGVLLTNLSAGNIKDGVTVKVGDSADDDCVTSVTGTYTGGSSEPITPKQINFIDYDGSIVQSYSASEFAQLSALPANPQHTGLVAQGWNWTMAQINTQLADIPDGNIWVGQSYNTDDSSTRVYISIPKETPADRRYVVMTGGQTVSNGVTINWGDGTPESSKTGTTFGGTHTYADPGDYVITLKATSGTMSFTYTNISENCLFGSIADATTYANARAWVQRIEVGSTVTALAYAFYKFGSLEYITLPTSITSIGDYSFQNCASLKSLTIPSSVTSLGQYACQYNYSLIYASIPPSVTSYNTYIFSECHALRGVTIPYGAGSIPAGTFHSCSALQEASIPSTVTTIGGNAFQYASSLQVAHFGNSFTSLTFSSNYAMADCVSLTSITIPAGTTSIGTYAFRYARTLYEVHIYEDTPPTLGTGIFQYASSTYYIYVPYSADHSILSAYQAAENWSAYASKMMEES